jgi:3-hydroxyacyl-[acyl-carrier-protein] dehydratase
MNMFESIQAARIGDVQRNGADSATLMFRFAATQPVFAGHFPGNPILPGIFQLEMARVAAEALGGASFNVREIVKAKFRRPIRPEETIRVVVKLVAQPDGHQARVTLSVEEQPAGEAILLLASRA